MSRYADWWQKLPGTQKGVYVVAVSVLLFSAAIDIGRELYQVTH